MGARRRDGHKAMKKIYDDLGIYKPMSWHIRQDDANVAHNWNSGDSMETIFDKLKEGSGEWDTSIKQALDSGRLTQARLDEVSNYYIREGQWAEGDTPYDSLGGIPEPPGTGEGDSPWEGDPQGVRPFGNTWWEANERYSTEQDHPYQQPRTDDVRLDLADELTFEGMTYAAPGRQGDYVSGDDKGDLHPSLGTDVGAQAAYDLETRFIDDLYGSDEHNLVESGRVFYHEDGTAFTEEETIAQAQQNLQDKIDAGTVDDSWGLDIRRDIPDNVTTGSQTWYEHITRGEVDWAYYQNSPAYQSAYQTLKDSGEFDDVFDDQGNITSVAEIRLINQETEGLVEDVLIEGQGKDAWRYDWDGRYEPGDPPAPWIPTELDVYKPGSGETIYNTVDERRVTRLDGFQENIFEVPPLNMEAPNVNIRIPPILRGGRGQNRRDPEVPLPPIEISTEQIGKKLVNVLANKPLPVGGGEE